MRLPRAGFSATPIQRPNVEPLPRQLLSNRPKTSCASSSGRQSARRRWASTPSSSRASCRKSCSRSSSRAPSSTSRSARSARSCTARACSARTSTSSPHRAPANLREPLGFGVARAADPERCSHSRGRGRPRACLGEDLGSRHPYPPHNSLHRGLHSRLRFEKIHAARGSRRRAGRMPALHEREGS